jgi:WD40 repeat protein
VRIYEWDFDLNKIFCKWICKGHERSVETVKSNAALSMIASASWDGQLKFWSTKDSGPSKDLGAAALTPTTNEVRVSKTEILPKIVVY